ncbi:hypothetical protein [Halosimplex pelagicum]|uniref:Uncharacterized protein n=1 Tax=Halosimplex pelagicum TaxID=869886 RepID=A0A7D5TCN8_9EURY|nr:hypothetical protein [Halosimplex pelagicum]QLH82215.1 hypothetical protein HZS54_11615 [Halosimplex pelagicum]
MSTDPQPVAEPTLSRPDDSIVPIAVAAAKETLLWIVKFFAFLGGVTAFSVVIAILSTTTIGGIIAFFVIIGIIASTPYSDRNYFFPLQ